MSHSFGSQRSFITRKRNQKRRKENLATIPNILCIGGANWLKKILLQDGENMLCSYLERKKASALFRGTQHQSNNQSTIA